MYKLLKLLIISIGLIASTEANALPLNQQPPAWVMPGAVYDFDFVNKRYWGAQIWLGGLNIANYGPSMFYYVGSGVNANTLFTQWKDGILRPSGTSSQQYIPRLSDYGLWIEGGPGTANNYALQSRDFTNASWTLSNITATKTGVVGADATTGNASQLTATANNGTALQTIAFTGKLDSNNAASTVVVAGGASYSTNDILTTVGGTCTTQPQLKVSSQSGGVVSAVTVQTAGACTVLPPNPVAVTGGTGTGATFNPFWRTGTTSAWFKRVSGAGTVSLTMNGGSTWTDISGLINSTRYLQERIPTANLVNNSVGIRLGTSGDVVDVDFFQTEDDDQATSPIMTTTAISGRGPENVFFGTNGTNYNYGLQIAANTQANTPWTIMFEYSGNFSTTLKHGLMTSDTPFVSTGGIGGGTIVGQLNGVNATSAASDVSGMYLNTTGAGTINKVVESFDGAGSKICVNGSAPTKATTPKFYTIFSGTHLNVLNNGANILPVNGYMPRMTIWKRGVSDGECTQYSTVINNQ